MSRPLSLAAKQSIAAPETGEVWLVLLTITHSTLPAPIRLVRNTKDVVSRGDTYTALPFDVVFPEEREDQLPQVTLRIDNVSREIGQAMRSIKGKGPAVRLEVVLASSLDTLEAGPVDCVLKERDIDAGSVSGTLGAEDMLNEPFPGDRFLPATFAGLFDV